MSIFQRFTRKSRAHTEAIEHEHDRSLAEAEMTLQDLKQRGEQAMSTLDERDRRNHWQEAVRGLIEGTY